MNKVKLVHVFLRALRFSPASIIPPLLQVHINSSIFLFLLAIGYAPGIEECLLPMLRRRIPSSHEPHLIGRHTRTNPRHSAHRILWQFIGGGEKSV